MSDPLGALLRSMQLAGIPMDAVLAMDSLWLALRMQERGGVQEADVPTVTSDRPTTLSDTSGAPTLPALSAL
ncbi:MAG: hypothetical protein ABI910_22525, partial [Gemmatimonadota bacterium]